MTVPQESFNARSVLSVLKQPFGEAIFLQCTSHSHDLQTRAPKPGLVVLYLICLTLVMLYNVNIVRKEIVMTQNTMQINDIVGIINWDIFTMGRGI